MSELDNRASLEIMLKEASLHAKTTLTDGVTSMIMLPWRAQFVYDTQAFLRKRKIEAPVLMPPLFQDGVKRSRLLLKLGDNRGIQLDDLVNTCLQAEDDMRIECKSPLPLIFPTMDTGIFYDENTKALVGTTTASSLWSGFALPELQSSVDGNRFTLVYGYLVGAYISTLAASFGTSISLPEHRTSLPLGYRDVIAEKYYSLPWRPSAEDKRFLRVVSSVAALIAASRLVRHFDLESPILEIKMALCGILHGSTTLHTLADDVKASDKLKALLSQVLSIDTPISKDTKKASTLRNVLFHYAIPKDILKSKHSSEEHFGLFHSVVKMSARDYLAMCRESIDLLFRALGNIVETTTTDRIMRF